MPIQAGALQIGDCFDSEKKVLPLAERIVSEQREQLQAFLPKYFDSWDSHASAHNLEDQPALHIEQLEHFVAQHCEKKHCAKHGSAKFPCGQAYLRSRGSGFSQHRRVDLHALEAACCVELNCLLKVAKVVLSYSHHQAANEHQSPMLKELQVAPRSKRRSDFRLEGTCVTSNSTLCHW